MQKWQSKKLIATTVSSREKGMRRREEGWTMSSQKDDQITETTITKDARVKAEAGTSS